MALRITGKSHYLMVSECRAITMCMVLGELTALFPV